MSASPLKRKLAAILAADAVGYSRHMGADEEGTMKLLAAHRAVIDGIIEFHEGRIVNTAGDSVLAEFASPVQAVRCAVEIQDALRTRNDARPEGKRLEFRIGVNLGDVMVKGDDLLGDGVNVAARLESVADPGGICVSSSVYDQIAGKLDLGFVDVGQKTLKNIDRPVRVYRVDRDGRRVSSAPRRESRGAGAKWFAGVALIAALAAGAWYFVLLPQSQEAERVEAAAKAAAEERARMEQLAKARAEAEAAKRRAEKEAEGAAEARRALEAQRAAEATARAQAEVARSRAEAEKAKRDATAELAAASEARRIAEEAAKASTKPKAPVVSLREGNWSAAIACPAVDGNPGRDLTIPVSVANDVIIVQHREPNTPGSILLRGTVNSDGILLLRGTGVSGRRGGGLPYPAGFKAKIVDDGYQGGGRLGRRECSLSVSRVP